MKKQGINWKKIFVNSNSDKLLVSTVYKNLTTIKRQPTQNFVRI